MSAAILSRVPSRLALLAVLGLAVGAAAAEVRTRTPGGGGPASPLRGREPARLKAAARAQVAKAAPGVRIDHVEISRIVGDYAVVTVYPDMKANPTDPAKVILQREGGNWKAIAGPGTAFPPGSRPAAPDTLFEFVSPRPTSWVPAGESARNAIRRLNVARKRFRNSRVTEQPSVPESEGSPGASALGGIRPPCSEWHLGAKAQAPRGGNTVSRTLRTRPLTGSVGKRRPTGKTADVVC